MSRRRRWMACVGVAAGAVAGTAFGAVQLTTASAAVAVPATVVVPLSGSPATQPPAGATTTTAAPTTTTATTAAPTVDPFQPVPPGSAATAHVSIVDFGFSPASITVAAGTTVTWTNTGASIHSVTSDSGAFDSSPSCPTGPCISPGSSFSHLFAQAGSFSYHCRVHPNMTGTVIVNAAPGTTTTTTSAPGTNPPATSPPVSAGGSPTPSVSSQATGSQLAFTGTSSEEAWLALGALGAITLGLALRPRRRPFPVPASPPSPPNHRSDRY